MDALKRIQKAARESVRTAELFSSRHLLVFLAAKLRYICNSFKVACPRLRLLFQEESPITACTSLGEMIINSAHEMFDGDDEARLLKVAGVLLHEVGHILFTNYTVWDLWASKMKRGLYYPTLPEVDPSLEEARAKLSEFCEDKRFFRGFLEYAHGLNNCLEDGRIENFILKSIRNARFMIKGLVVLRQETYAEMPSFEEIKAQVDSEDRSELSAMLQLVLHYARFREVKGKLDDSCRIGRTIKALMPEIDRYLDEIEAVACYDAFNKILVMMAEIIMDQFEKETAEMQGQSQGQGQQSQQSGQGGQGQSQGQSQGQGSSSQGSGQSESEENESDSDGSGGGSEGEESEESESQNGGSDGNSEESEGESESDGSSSEESEEEEEADGSSDEPEMSAEEIAEALKDMVEKMLEELVGASVDNSERMGDQAKGADRGSVGRRLSGLAKGPDGGEVETENAAEASTEEGVISHEEALGETNISLTLDDIARKIADDLAEEAISSEIKSDYADVASAVQDYSEIHRYTDITMYHYAEVDEADRRAYDEIARQIAPLVKRAVKGSNFYEKDRRSYVEEGLFSGMTLHAEQSYKKDGRIFSKTYDKDEPPEVALAVRIDCSGSMHGDRILAAQRACIFLYEYALGMAKKYNVKIPLYIYGDCTDREAYGVNMYVVCDDKYRTSTEKYRIMRLAAGGCNRDGLPIRMAVKRLEQEHPYASKVLFNITDGQPNDSGYGGEPAWDDLRDITKHCDRKRIALAACAIGNDRDKIEDIYGSSHFLNISDLNELPIRLVKILTKLLK